MMNLMLGDSNLAKYFISVTVCIINKALLCRNKYSITKIITNVCLVN